MAVTRLACLLTLLSVFLSCLVTSAPLSSDATHSSYKRDILPPSEDPFYQPPGNFASYAPGDILRTRLIATPTVIALLAPVRQTYQFLYRSTDSNGNPSAVVLTVLAPIQALPDKFLSYQWAYDGAFVDCSPSYTMQMLTSPSLDTIPMILALEMGYYVSTADFEGFDAAFTNGIQSGQAVLDGIRATLKSSELTGISPTARVVLNGGSGGALASEWALELLPTYAPEMEIAGAALGSLTPNISEVYNTVNGGSLAGLGPTGILGLSYQSEPLVQYLNDNLVPEKADTFRQAGKQCLTANQAQFANQNISLYFKNPNFLSDEVPQAAIRTIGTMGVRGTPKTPMYVYKGGLDEVSAVADTDALMEKYCEDGANIIYVRNSLGAHETESVLGIVGAFFYLEDRLNGLPITTGCTFFNISKDSLNPTDVATLGLSLVNIINSIVGLPGLA